MANLLWKILICLFAGLYLISPIDAFPDFALIGFVDDLFILVLAVYLLRSWLPQRQHQKSKRAEGENRARTKDPYHILGIDQRANKEEIERAYKRLAAKYHPDKVTHLGKDFQELAHRKFIEIQKAYRQVLSKSKG